MWMKIDTDRIDEVTLALLWLGLHDYTYAQKTFDRETLDRLRNKGMISDINGEADCVVFSEEGRARAAELYRTIFAYI
jgi:hypothetical protein